MEKTYQVNSPLRHNGERYEVDSLVVLNDEQAQPLIKEGVIAHISFEDVPPVVGAEVLAKLFADAQIRDKPTVKTVFEIAGTDDLSITEAVIDEAWALHQADVIRGIVECFYAFYGDGEKADKKPNVEDVRKWCENPDITTAQRDEAWIIYKAEDK